MSLAKVKAVDDRTKSITFGYCRKRMKELSIDIPVMIQYVILLYYWIEEKFKFHGDCIKIAHPNRLSTDISKINNENNESYNAIYGNNVIDINDTSIVKYIWSIKYEKQSAWAIRFGIDSEKDYKQYLHRSFTDDYFPSRSTSDKLVYAFSTAGYTFTTKNRWQESNAYGELGDANKGDIHTIELILNVQDRKLSVNCMGRLETVGENIDLENNRFNFAVSMSLSKEHSDIVELVDFKTIQK